MCIIATKPQGEVEEHFFESFRRWFVENSFIAIEECIEDKRSQIKETKIEESSNID